ncbi:MAG: SAM-dependent methyltransferase [Tetrasphaera sp.]|nr:SAM-dependent methyltransferase [Tetrasphaera sp.]
MGVGCAAVRPWVQAWDEALYAETGFYRRPEGPAGHFATSCHGPAGAVFAEAVVALARREGLTTIVDLGAGRGELLAAIARIVAGPGGPGGPGAWGFEPVAGWTGPEPGAPGTGAGGPGPDGAGGSGEVWRLVGVEVAEPARAVAAVEWRVVPGGARTPGLRDLGPVLVIANEWLDVVPCVIAQRDRRGVLREVHVDHAGTESLGPSIRGVDLDWAGRWWPRGERVEIGRARDEALGSLLGQVHSGLVVAIDYGHVVAERPADGTLVGYRSGRQVRPVPDGSCDLTAHVAVDSLPHDRLVRQRDALAQLGIRTGGAGVGAAGAGGERSAYDLARRDPIGYLAARHRDSAVAELTGAGLGDFWWAITRVG